MHKSAIITLAVFATFCVLQSQSLPVSQDLWWEEADDIQPAHVRVRRFTCDVLSAEAKGVKLNHAACALHCLALKKSGGYCNAQAVCVCR